MKAAFRLSIALALMVSSVSASAGLKTYPFPGIRVSVSDASNAPVAGAQVDADLRMRERKFDWYGLFPLADLTLCEMGKAIGSTVCGFMGCSQPASQMSCWEYWHQDVGLKPVEDDNNASALSGLGGNADFAPKTYEFPKDVRHFVPTFESRVPGVLTAFSYSSAHTPSASLICHWQFSQAACQSLIPGAKAISAAAKSGVHCRLPFTSDELQAHRAASVERCRARVEGFEQQYGASWVASFGDGSWVDAQ